MYDTFLDFDFLLCHKFATCEDFFISLLPLGIAFLELESLQILFKLRFFPYF